MTNEIIIILCIISFSINIYMWYKYFKESGEFIRKIERERKAGNQMIKK